MAVLVHTLNSRGAISSKILHHTGDKERDPVVAWHIVSKEQVQLGIDELCKLFPPPVITEDTKTNQPFEAP